MVYYKRISKQMQQNLTIFLYGKCEIWAVCSYYSMKKFFTKRERE